MVSRSSGGMTLLCGVAGGVLEIEGMFWATGALLGPGSTLGVGLQRRGKDGSSH